jgi:polyhydroxyalkanoate synthesis regulator protein
VVPQYLDAAMDSFKRNQKAITDAFAGNAFADIAKRNMEMFGGAGRAGAATNPSPGASEEELEQLRAELAALQQKVDKLSK